MIVGAIASLFVTTVAAASGDSTEPLELERVVEVELRMYAGHTRDDISRDGFTDSEQDAAEKRRAFTQHLEDFDWGEAIGSENYGGVNLEADGSLMVRWVEFEPDPEQLPSGYEYRFEQTDETWADYVARLDAEPIGDETLLSNPGEAHDIIRAGQGFTGLCDPPPGQVGKREQGTVTAVVTWLNNNNNRRHGILTAGHVLWLPPSCGPLSGGSGQDDEYHFWMGDPDDFGNTYYNGPGFGSWYVDTEDPLVGKLDVGIARIPSPDRQEKVHLGPKNGWGSQWLIHKEKFGLPIFAPTSGFTYCLQKSQNDPSPPDWINPEEGLTCGVVSYIGSGRYQLQAPVGEGAVGGDSGAPIFNLASPHPRPVLMVYGTNGILPQEHSDPRAIRIVTQLDAIMATWPSGKKELEICTPLGTTSPLDYGWNC